MIRTENPTGARVVSSPPSCRIRSLGDLISKEAGCYLGLNRARHRVAVSNPPETTFEEL
jgi:hypothetical protein